MAESGGPGGSRDELASRLSRTPRGLPRTEAASRVTRSVKRIVVEIVIWQSDGIDEGLLESNKAKIIEGEKFVYSTIARARGSSKVTAVMASSKLSFCMVQ